MFKIRQTLAIVAALLLTSLMPASADYVINWILMLTRRHLIGGAAAVLLAIICGGWIHGSASAPPLGYVPTYYFLGF